MQSDAPDITIRRAAPEDLELSLPLVAAFHLEEGVESRPEDRRAAISRILGDTGIGEMWLIETAGAAVGYLVLAYGFSIEFNGRDAFLDEIFVTKAARGRGLGRAALRKARDDMAARGVKAIHLEVAVDNDRAQKLYSEEGFALRRGYKLMSARIAP